MFNGKPWAGNSREFPVSQETGGKFLDLGNSRATGNSREFLGNFLGISWEYPKIQEFPKIWEFPGKFPRNIPYLESFPGKLHGKFPNLGKVLGNSREFPVAREFPRSENFPPVSRGAGNSREFPARGFPLNIAAPSLLCLASIQPRSGPRLRHLIRPYILAGEP